MICRKVNEEEYIDLGELLEVLVRKIWLIVLIGVTLGAMAFVYSSYIATPIYESSAMMIVNSGERDYVTQDQLNSAASLVDTYSVIITSDTVLDQVKDILDMEDTFEERVKEVRIESVNGTQVMEIAVRADSPKIAHKVCRQITRTCPSVIVDTVEAGSVKLVSKASMPQVPVSPNVKSFTLVGLLLGMLLSAGMIVMYTLMDNKIKNENDLEAAGIPMLGLIPHYEMEG